MSDDMKKFLDSTGLKYRTDSEHYQLDCFLCKDTRQRLGVNISSHQWKCFKCDSCGTKLSTLKYAFEHKSNFKTKDKIDKTEQEEKCTIKQEFHKQFIEFLKNSKKYPAAKYLIKERKISKAAIRHFQLGARRIFKDKKGKKYDAGNYVAIPYIKEGKCVNVKYRAIDKGHDKKFKWRREKGGISALYNEDVIDNLDYDEIYIVESEIDCISLWELGIKNVVGLTVGAKGFKQPWYERLERFSKIHLVLDNDKAGQDGAKKLARRLGMGRCYNIILPDDVNDPNDYLRKYKLDDFKRVALKGKRFEVEKARNLNQVLDIIYDERITNPNPEEDKSFQTPWRKVNNILGPVKKGFLKVLAGKPKSGKTTAALNLMKHWGDKGIHTGIYTCEMRDVRLGEKFLMMESPSLDSIENITPLQFKQARYRLPSEYIHSFYPTEPSELELENVVTKIEELVQRYGIEVMIIDNLHFLCRGEDENSMVSMATQQFKLLAERMDIVVILITHPRKTNNNKQLKTDDLKGSSSIFQDADIVWLMHRPFNDGDMLPDEASAGAVEGSMSPRTEISITGRWTEGGKTFLAFNGARSIFKDKGRLYNQVAKELGQKKKRKGGM